MFGAFKPTLARLGGLLWKVPAMPSRAQKARHRLRMSIVDRNIARVAFGLQQKNLVIPRIVRRMQELPKEAEMDPKNKYTVFSRTAKKYRKAVHRQPKWTKITNRTSPKGF